MDRRSFLRAAGLAGFGLAALSVKGNADLPEEVQGMLDAAKRDAEGKLEYTLPPLPYAYDALEPVISKAQLELHHDKHHAAYVA
ncbi:MAG: superoxide dismutase, partial [Armatimonadetes bacterium]|nr:superoxide dismutase [Armatimonadota bacterium]